VSDVIAATFSGGGELAPNPELACECGEAGHHWQFSNFAKGSGGGDWSQATDLQLLPSQSRSGAG